MLVCMFKGYSFVRQIQQRDTDLARLGTCLLACIAGTLLMLYNCSFIFGYEKIFYVLAGLTAAYFRYCTAQAEVKTAQESQLPGFGRDAPQSA